MERITTRLSVGAIVVGLTCSACAVGSLTYGSELEHREDAIVSGRLMEAGGRPLAGARVSAEVIPSRELEPAVVTSDADGRFDLPVSVLLQVLGRSPFLGPAIDNPPPRYPLKHLDVVTADGRNLRVERPAGRWRRHFDDEHSSPGRLVYSLGDVVALGPK